MDQSFNPVTAYHEAGHAVIALVVGRPVRSVSVMPNRDFLGMCQFHKGVFRPSKDWLEEEILISLGGASAEAIHTGEYSFAGASRDLQYVRRLAVKRAGERKAERLIRRSLAKVENMLAVEEHWQAVELIAAELLRLGTISGRAALHFFERCRSRDI
jgi:ATP-dependent Zn protease